MIIVIIRVKVKYQDDDKPSSRHFCFSNQQRLWKANHPQYDISDPYHKLTRAEQVIISRLRTNHNRLKHHLLHKFRIGETDKCPCSTSSQTRNHILQECPRLEDLRKKHWLGPTPTSVNQKLYGILQDLRGNCILC